MRRSLKMNNSIMTVTRAKVLRPACVLVERCVCVGAFRTSETRCVRGVEHVIPSTRRFSTCRCHGRGRASPHSSVLLLFTPPSAVLFALTLSWCVFACVCLGVTPLLLLITCSPSTNQPPQQNSSSTDIEMCSKLGCKNMDDGDL